MVRQTDILILKKGNEPPLFIVFLLIYNLSTISLAIFLSSK